MSHSLRYVLATVVLLAKCSVAQIPQVLSYQGRVSVSGTPFSGTGQFKFALVSPTGNASVPATATASVVSGFLVSITVVNGGSGYTAAPAVSIIDPSGTGALATATVSVGSVVAITVQSAGRGYSSSPTVAIDAPPAVYSYVTFWSNDGTSVDGSEPTNAVLVRWPSGFSVSCLGTRRWPT